MAHREFQDERGQFWEVWDVVPERRDRRTGVDRRRSARETFDRRKARVLSAAISGDFAKGWLVFSTKFDRRRYVPLPARWNEATEIQLRAWCAAAVSIPLPRRLIE
ncbi:MAG TPA: hypothetical protein VGJ18_25035 [Gemmatimonadaceae bacterium]|jgi:hypothetical protein